MTVRFLDIAEVEPDQAIRWYESQAPGLGDAFLIEVLAATDRIVLYPEAWQPLEEEFTGSRLERARRGRARSAGMTAAETKLTCDCPCHSTKCLQQINRS